MHITGCAQKNIYKHVAKFYFNNEKYHTSKTLALNKILLHPDTPQSEEFKFCEHMLQFIKKNQCSYCKLAITQTTFSDFAVLSRKLGKWSHNKETAH